MKIIPKLQKGGGFSSFFTMWTPVETAKQQVVQESSSKKKDKSDSDDSKKVLTEKDLFSMLKDIDGLDNDMWQITRNLINTIQTNNLLGIQVEDLATTYLKSLYQIKVANTNKTKYDAAYEKARENGALAEPAISIDGNLIAQDDNGDIIQVSLEDYQFDPDGVHLLSVAQLASLRRYDPKLTNTSFAFDIMNNSMGFESFQKLLDQAKAQLGSTSYSRDGQFMFGGDDAKKGLAVLGALSQQDRDEILLSISKENEGLYSYNVSNDSNRQQVEALVNYMVAVLPERAKTWAAFKLKTPNKDAAAKTLVTQYLSGRINESHSTKTKYEGDPSDNGSANGTSTDLDKLPTTDAMRWLLGMGSEQMFDISLGTNTHFLVNAIGGQVTGQNGKAIGADSTLKDITQGNFGEILDISNASMAGLMIDPNALSKVVLNDGVIYSIDFPSSTDNFGNVRPNLDPVIISRKSKADTELRQRGIDINSDESKKQNYQIINQIYKKYGLSEPYTSDGSLNQHWTRFGVLNATASKTVLEDKDLNSSLARMISNPDIVNSLNELTKSNISEGWLGGYDDDEAYYQSTVWIPVKKNYIGSLSTNNLTVGQAMKLYNKQKLDEIQYNTPPKI